MTTPQHVVIIGGGFGGLQAARSLKRAPIQITLLDRRNFHLFQALLYQVATGALSPADIASPIRGILKHQRNVQVLLAEATRIDAANRKVILSDGEVSYDTLIIATGSTHQYFGNDQWAEYAPGLKTIEDATDMRRRLLLAFEAAERESNPEKLRALMTFVIIGGGPTGVELAGALAEISHDTLKYDFRTVNPADAKIILVEALDRILRMYPESLSSNAEAKLRRLGVDVRLKTAVMDIQAESVTVKSGDKTEIIPTHTVLWGAGVRGSSLGKALAESTGVALDNVGRVMVEPDCTIKGHPEIFVIGDLANFSHHTGQPLPGVAQVALQQASYAANVVKARLAGKKTPSPFRYRNLGNMATIGRGAAIADLGWIRFTGYIGWLAWLFIHLMRLVGYRNRVAVFLQWAWSYFTYNRSARLVTGEKPFPLVDHQPLDK